MSNLIYEIKMFLYTVFMGWAFDICPNDKYKIELALFLQKHFKNLDKGDKK